LTKTPQIRTVAGLMSGTSLDGLDIAVCRFKKGKKGYKFKILAAQTIPHSSTLKLKLKNIYSAKALDIVKLHHEFGKYLGENSAKFLKEKKLKADAISSHGHTIFHQPQLGFTTQIGCGAAIAAATKTTTVCDLRSLDVALAGQGAPLVPIGDKLLFGNYDSCLNLGGIANISFDKKGQRQAFDICICNMALNFLAEKNKKAFDQNGKMAASGAVNKELLRKLNALEFYKIKGSRSLGYEDFEERFLPILKGNTNDLLATFTEHAAQQIADVLNTNKLRTVLITGGGVFNTHLITLIKQKTKCKVIIPNKTIINFKEAIIFAFLGYLRLHHRINTLSTVTGAKSNSIGGAVYVMEK
jgi:anhydro-N-acetylmuramic acid kinase